MQKTRWFGGGGGGSRTSRCLKEFGGLMWLPLSSGSPVCHRMLRDRPVPLPSSALCCFRKNTTLTLHNCYFVLNFPPRFPGRPKAPGLRALRASLLVSYNQWRGSLWMSVLAFSCVCSHGVWNLHGLKRSLPRQHSCKPGHFPQSIITAQSQMQSCTTSAPSLPPGRLPF